MQYVKNNPVVYPNGCKLVLGINPCDTRYVILYKDGFPYAAFNRYVSEIKGCTCGKPSNCNCDGPVQISDPSAFIRAQKGLKRNQPKSMGNAKLLTNLERSYSFMPKAKGESPFCGLGWIGGCSTKGLTDDQICALIKGLFYSEFSMQQLVSDCFFLFQEGDEAKTPIALESVTAFPVVIEGVMVSDKAELFQAIAKKYPSYTYDADCGKFYGLTTEDAKIECLPIEQPNPELSINKVANKTNAKAGETLDFLVTVENTGNVKTTNVVIEDILPPELSFVSASVDEDPTATFVVDSNDVVVKGDCLDAGEQILVRISTLVSTELEGDVLNGATVSSDQTSPEDVESSIEVLIAGTPPEGEEKGKRCLLIGENATNYDAANWVSLVNPTGVSPQIVGGIDWIENASSSWLTGTPFKGFKEGVIYEIEAFIHGENNCELSSGTYVFEGDPKAYAFSLAEILTQLFADLGCPITWFFGRHPAIGIATEIDPDSRGSYLYADIPCNKCPDGFSLIIRQKDVPENRLGMIFKELSYESCDPEIDLGENVSISCPKGGGEEKEVDANVTGYTIGEGGDATVTGVPTTPDGGSYKKQISCDGGTTWIDSNEGCVDTPVGLDGTEETQCTFSAESGGGAQAWTGGFVPEGEVRSSEGVCYQALVTILAAANTEPPATAGEGLWTVVECVGGEMQAGGETEGETATEGEQSGILHNGCVIAQESHTESGCAGEGVRDERIIPTPVVTETENENDTVTWDFSDDTPDTHPNTTASTFEITITYDDGNGNTGTETITFTQGDTPTNAALEALGVVFSDDGMTFPSDWTADVELTIDHNYSDGVVLPEVTPATDDWTMPNVGVEKTTVFENDKNYFPITIEDGACGCEARTSVVVNISNTGGVIETFTAVNPQDLSQGFTNNNGTTYTGIEVEGVGCDATIKAFVDKSAPIAFTGTPQQGLYTWQENYSVEAVVAWGDCGSGNDSKSNTYDLQFVGPGNRSNLSEESYTATLTPPLAINIADYSLATVQVNNGTVINIDGSPTTWQAAWTTDYLSGIVPIEQILTLGASNPYTDFVGRTFEFFSYKDETNSGVALNVAVNPLAATAGIGQLIFDSFLQDDLGGSETIVSTSATNIKNGTATDNGGNNFTYCPDATGYYQGRVQAVTSGGYTVYREWAFYSQIN